jgi:tight adherence protein C
MSVLLIGLIALIVVACSVVAYVLQLNRERQVVLTRADARVPGTQTPITILRQPTDSVVARFAEWLRDRTPASWSQAGEASDVLVHAGLDGPMAPLFYTTIRLTAAVMLPLLTFMLAPQRNLSIFMALMVLSLAAGIIGPRAVVDRMALRRRERVKKSLPDCLDLLVVCIEAGVSFDAAMLRVARDMEAAHPELSSELWVVNRKMNAGMVRDEAVSGLWRRTGVEEMRGLCSSIIQSERLGTSIARVLRTYAETLRRKRKQAAEKRAAEAALKMIFPLAVFLLPALFAVILGPAAIKAGEVMRNINAP